MLLGNGTAKSVRARRPLIAGLAALLAASTLAVLAPASPAFAAESLAVTKTASESVLVGTPVSIEISATNNGDEPEFNLSFRDELPLGVTYVPGSTAPAAAGEPRIVTAGTGRQTLIWENVSDLPVGGAQSISFTAMPDPDDHPVGSTFGNVGEGYANSDPRTLPKFDENGAYASGATADDASNTAETTITAITVDKTEPSPEHELLRGVHDHSTPYTLTVTNNGESPDDDVVLVDLLPAQLEYLGCGTVDNTPDDGREYAGAPRLDDSTPDVADCVAPVSVTTVTDPAGVPAGVYTRVEWNLGTLAPNQVVEVVYRAGIPQRANTATFAGGTPAGPLGQVANLDNNTGASTREVGEQALTNQATVSADYTGTVAGGSTAVSDSDSLTVTAEDLAMQKSVDPTVFTHDGIATYTLELQTGEYADADDIVITDEIPNGLCPLDNVTNHTAGDVANCDPGPAFAPDVAYAGVDEKPEGGFTVVFQPIDMAANASRSISYQARMLADYRGPGGDPTVVGDSYRNTADLTAQTTTLAAVEPPDGVSTETVGDESSATLESEAVVLDKEIQANTGPTPYECGTDADDYADSSTLTPAETTFTEGSRVCFLLRIQFPAGNETKNPVLTDFLPDYVDYEGGSVEELPGNTVTTVDVDEPNLTFTLGTPTGGDGDRFVQGGQVFLYTLSGIVNRSARTTPDVTGNLAKLTWVDTAGEVGFLRDREDFSISAPPPVSVTKAATRVSSVAPGTDGPLADGGDPDPAGRIRAGDEVEFTVTTTNDGTPADRNDLPVVGPDVWDVLPLGITCADVSSMDNGGVCTDPTDPSHPTFADWTTRSAIRWNRPDSVTIAPGAGNALEFTYQVTYPATVAAGATYRNDVDVASYATSSNIETLAQHYPADNVDTTVPPEQEDAPRAHDDHTVLTPASGITKTNTTQVADVDQGTGSSLHYAAIGETVTYTVTGTVPANTTIYDGVLFDTTPTGLRVDGVVYEYHAAPGDAFGPLPAGFTGSTTATGPQIAFPPLLDAGMSADEVQMTITATVLTNAVNVHGAVRTNTARMSSTTEAGAPITPPLSASSSVTVVEPSPAPLKTVDEDEPGAGQSVTYTVTARNANPANLDQMRPTLFDSQIVDCVPSGLAVSPAPLNPTVGTATVGAVGTSGCAAERTPVVWQVGDLAWRSVADAAGSDPWPTLTYVAVVNPLAGGDVAYVNTATQSGTSMAGADADEKTYSAVASETVTVPGGVLRKRVTPVSAPVGDTVTYTVEVDLPANVNFYDASIIDTLPAGIAPSSVVRTGLTCAYTDVDPTAPCSMAAPTSMAAVGQVHGWLLGEIVAADPRPRTVTLTYTAVIGVVAGNVASTTLTNSAALKWNQSETPTTPPPPVNGSFDSETDPGNATVTVTEPSLSITKAVSNPTPAPGVDFTYTVRVTNASGANRSAAHDVDVVDALPAGVQVIGSPSNGGVVASGPPGGGTITWSDLGPIAPGTTVELTYTGRLTSPAPTTAQTNVVDVTAYTSLNDGGRTYLDTPTDDAEVIPAVPELTVTKTALDVPAYLGEPARWRIAVTNDGDAPGFDVDVEDVLPTGWTYDAGSAQVSVAGATPAQEDPDSATGSPVQTLQWANLGDLDPGESITIDFTATPGAALAPTRVGSTVVHQNAVTATIQDLDGSSGSVVDTEGATAQTRIDAANLTLTKAAVGTPVAGEPFSWTLTAANAGPDTAVGPFVVTDDLPSQVTGATAAGAGWTCSTATATITCQRTNPAATLASGASLPVITVNAQVPATTPAGTTLVNAAAVEGRTYETTLADNDDEVSVDVVTESDFGIDKSLVGALVPGTTATYTLAVRNDGPSVARGAIVVTDTLPPGLTYESFAGTGWALAQNGQQLTFTWTGASPVHLGAMPQITVTVQVASGVTGPVTNTASVTEPTDPTSGPESPDSDSVTDTPPAPSADLGIAKSSPDPLKPGTQGVYELQVHNYGPSDAAGPITVTDTLPGQLT